MADIPNQYGFLAPVLSGLLLGFAIMAWAWFVSRVRLRNTAEWAESAKEEARRDADAIRKESAVQAQEAILRIEQDAERREKELEERDARLEKRSRSVEQRAADVEKTGKRVDRAREDVEARLARAGAAEERAVKLEKQAHTDLERVAGLSAAEARSELIASIETEARNEAARLARKIEDEARQNAEREARNLIVQASQRVHLQEVMESTVSFIELPTDEMKGRIIGKEGRNIRALEMATGIDLIVDDTPRSVWISSFDPMRREIARVAIDALLQDGRIHPARIEEAVQQAAAEMETRIEENGSEAAFSLGISDLHPRLVRLVGRARYYTTHGQNLLQHVLETAQIAGHMVEELGGNPKTAIRAGLLHEVGQVAEPSGTHATLQAAELCTKYGESEEVADAIRSLHPDIQPASVEALLLNTANRLSENRPGARKENLSVFIERLRRIESIATGFDGVSRAYAVKAGKELRVIVDADGTQDATAFQLSKKIARALEKELTYPGQIKVCVIRETRAVRFAV